MGAARALAPLLAPLFLAMAAVAHAADDPYLWLEEVAGEKPLAWVHRQNAATRAELEARPAFRELHERFLAIYNSKSRIPSVHKRGEHLYNFWQDEANPRGVLRRTTLAEYRKAEPRWETVLDLGRLSAEEKEKWVYKGSTCLYPEETRCLVSLSRAGADAVEMREFDAAAKGFVDGGFRMPESKGGAAWRDADTLYVSRDFGPGTTTRSGYPRIVKEWKRGTPLAEAKVIFEAEDKDVGAWPSVVNEPGRRYELIRRQIDTRFGEDYLRVGDRWVRLDLPRDAEAIPFNGLLVARLRSDWKPGGVAFKAGSLVAADLDEFLAGKRDFQLVFEPTARRSLQAYVATRNFLVLDVLDNVRGSLVEARLEQGRWRLREVPVPQAASLSVAAYDRDESDDYWLTLASFTQPTTLYLAGAGGDRREAMKFLPAFFEAKGIVSRQFEATSKDGTKVPYFLVMREGAKGPLPTILYGYGGFEIAMTPSYSATVGAGWLERGGAWVLSNIRGGGEFGPAWHQAARREGRQKAHDDYIAVAEDLIRRGITDERHLGILGGSQGGLLVGAALTQRPELFRAAVSTVPLLDMKRYHKLLAGASWMGEYGNPDDPADWAFISKYSPYQNVHADRKYPRVLFATSTRDDRVHPGHARKMFAKMKAQGHDVLYFEYTEGGHGAGSLPAQQAYTWALIYTFFDGELR